MVERSAEHVTAMVERYAWACTEGTGDDVAALFAENAQLRDPYDGPTITGRPAILEFFSKGVALIDLMALAGPISITGDAASAAVPIRAEVTLDGVALEIRSVDVFYFDDDGLFGAMHAFYGPTNVGPRAG